MLYKLTKKKYIEDGMDGYLCKPIENIELVKLLDLYLDGLRIKSNN